MKVSDNAVYVIIKQIPKREIFIREQPILINSAISRCYFLIDLNIYIWLCSGNFVLYVRKHKVQSRM